MTGMIRPGPKPRARSFQSDFPWRIYQIESFVEQQMT
jgi:hypothetical protein